MKKKILSTLIIVTILFSMGGCDISKVNVNVDNSENLSTSSLGRTGLTEIGDGLYYDSATRIVYIILSPVGYKGYMSAYYAPNGLPYRYNPEANTFEEIDNCCEYCADARINEAE